MNHMSRLILVKNLIRILPYTQVTIFTTEKDPRFAGLAVFVSVGFDGLAYEAGASGYEDGGVGHCWIVCCGGVVFWRNGIMRRGLVECGVWRGIEKSCLRLRSFVILS